MPSTPASAPLWKQEVNRRLAAHRNRRPMPLDNGDQPCAARQASTRASLVAARVAARYAQTPSYADLEIVAPTEPVKTLPLAFEAQAAAPAIAPPRPVPEPLVHPAPAPVPIEKPAVARKPAAAPVHETSQWLFDAAPAFADSVNAADSNVIEFPRQAWTQEIENEAIESPALSIFEVEPMVVVESVVLPVAEPVFYPETVAVAYVPEPVSYAAAPAVYTEPQTVTPADNSYLAAASEPWIPLPTTSRWPGRRMVVEEAIELAPDPVRPAPVMNPAAMDRRLLAGFVDFCLIGLSFVGVAALAVSQMDQMPTLRALETTAVIAAALIGMIYLATFAALSLATPGMRYAGLTLSSFENQAPRREQRMGRMVALLLSLAPLGLGVIWTLFDEERLGWHDRLSQTYPRKR